MTQIDTLTNLESLYQSLTRESIERLNLALIEVSQRNVIYLTFLCNTVPPQRPKSKIGNRVRVQRKSGTFHRSYKIQFIEELLTISHIPTMIPLSYVVMAVKNEIIQTIFNEPDHVNFVTTN